MCGIAGFMTHARFDRHHALMAMGDELRHRGPDDHGTFVDEDRGVYLCHRRLSVLDLSRAGRQPLRNEQGTTRVVVNGEFYNYRALRRELEKEGCTFVSNSDSEVAVHGYDRWGLGVMDRLDGMYALAVWDSLRDRLVLARDPLGIKPLLYMNLPRGLFFASEARAFHALPRDIFDPRFDEESLHMLLCFQYIYEPERTAYRNVHRVPPGTCMVYEHGRLTRNTFWTLTPRPEYAHLDSEESERLVEERLDAAVKSHLQSDVPVGVMLSGGLDSSLVAAFASRHAPGSVRTFTAGFAHRWDERPFAREVAGHLGTLHHEVFVDPAHISERLEELVGHLDDLTSLDGGMFTVFLISEQMKEFGVKVLLVGEGADEVFGGYSWFGLSRKPFNGAPPAARGLAFYYAVSRMLPGMKNLGHIRTISRLLAGNGEREIFRQIGAFEITRQLPNHFLMKVDHGTMAHGLEARVPFLDRGVVELGHSLPSQEKLEGDMVSLLPRAGKNVC